MRFTHLEAFWLRLSRLGAALPPARPAGCGGRGGREGGQRGGVGRAGGGRARPQPPLSPAPPDAPPDAAGRCDPPPPPAGAGYERGNGGERGARCPPPSTAPAPLCPPGGAERGLPEQRDFERGGGNPQPAPSAPPRAERPGHPPPPRGLFWGGRGRAGTRGDVPGLGVHRGVCSGRGESHSGPPQPANTKGSPNPPVGRVARTHWWDAAEPTTPLNCVSPGSRARPAHTGMHPPPLTGACLGFRGSQPGHRHLPESSSTNSSPFP